MATPKVMTYQQRYEMVPVRDDLGEHKKVPVIDKRTGKQKTDKHGNLTFRKLTVADHDKPKPINECERCHSKLVIGAKYRVVAIKTAFGGYDRFRCMECPSWAPWELSNSLSARIQQIQSEVVDGDQWTCQEDAEARAEELAEMIRELASEKEEAAQNMEDGFGHSTSQSEEIAEQAQQLNEWADSVEESGSDADFPEPEETECPECSGTGKVETDESAPDEVDCEAEGCENGMITPDEPTEDQLGEWQAEAADNIQSALDNSPL
jgi:hypothetical protein